MAFEHVSVTFYFIIKLLEVIESTMVLFYHFLVHHHTGRSVHWVAEYAYGVSPALTLKRTCYAWPFDTKVYLIRWEYAYLGRLSSQSFWHQCIFLTSHIAYIFRYCHLSAVYFFQVFDSLFSHLAICYCVFDFYTDVIHNLLIEFIHVIYVVMYYGNWWYTLGAWVWSIWFWYTRYVRFICI